MGIDEELAILSKSSKRILDETEAVVIANPPEVISRGQDKWKTFEFLKKNDLPCAESSLVADQDRFAQEFGFPLVVKPREGHGPLHMYVVKNGDEIRRLFWKLKESGWSPMFQVSSSPRPRVHDGVTIDREGKYVMSSISMRRKLKDGQTYKAFVDDFPDIRKFAEETSMKIGARGP